MKFNLKFTKIFSEFQFCQLAVFTLHGLADLAELKTECSLNNY